MNAPERNAGRPTLALLVSELDGVTQSQTWLAVAEAARAADANLFCFVGGRLGGGDDAPYEIQRNAVYELANTEQVDGLIVALSSVGHRSSDRDLVALARGFQSVPVVSLGTRLRGVPSVMADPAQGLRAAIGHLIEDHGARRVAFIGGPEGQPEADERYAVYRDVLAAHGISYDRDLVATGDYVSGAPACRLLLEERGVTFDALVVANDGMARSAIDELQRRGLRVPRDVAVVGYDDAVGSRFSVPPLTTVSQPTRAMALAATEMVLAMIRGEQVNSVRLPSLLVVRRSCGCIGSPQAGASATGAAGEASQGVALAEPGELSIGLGRLGIGPDDVRSLRTSFAGAVDGTAEGDGFLVELDRMLPRIDAGADFGAWHEVLSELRTRAMRQAAEDSATLLRAGELVDLARLLVSEASQQAEASRAIEMRRLEDSVREVGLDLLAASDTGELSEVLANALPRIGIESCVMALYQEGGETSGSDHPYSPVPEWAEVALAYHDGRRQQLSETVGGGEEARSRARALVPPDHLPSDRTFSLIVEPLTFEETQLGYAMFEPGPLNGPVYGTLRDYLSTAVHGARMTGSMARRTRQLQTALDVVKSTDAGVDPDNLAQHIVDTLQDSLGVHFVGLYQREDQWAWLWSGSCPEGALMRSEGYRLRVGGGSAVGQCAVAGEPQFVRSTDGGPILVGDRYLPDTRSEVAVPLISRGDVLGILSLRSAEISAFQSDDLPTLMALAEQIAGAIANARMFGRSQRALDELQRIQDQNQQQAWSDYLEVVPVTEYALGDDAAGADSPVIAAVDAALAKGAAPGSLAREGDSDEATSSLIVPITQGGTTIGALGVHDEEARQWTDDELALAQSVVERMGLAMENLRLLDETRRRVAVEQLTQSITAEMRQTLDVDQVLRSAVQRIAEAFDATEVTIRLATGDQPTAVGTDGSDSEAAASDNALRGEL